MSGSLSTLNVSLLTPLLDATNRRVVGYDPATDSFVVFAPSALRGLQGIQGIQGIQGVFLLASKDNETPVKLFSRYGTKHADLKHLYQLLPEPPVAN